ncbi:MAG: TlpA family protein disulfide reductase [Clostridium sp.]|nr:TlpA family protein disulfide reductase [Prevotella sp.]MCM1428624.1 TlpA family protein disulfide reductase [Clostridium sp.]MCM1475753.1 TlpA family protein disulfide reductase [Muribaculaceae bacterium]
MNKKLLMSVAIAMMSSVSLFADINIQLDPKLGVSEVGVIGETLEQAFNPSATPSTPILREIYTPVDNKVMVKIPENTPLSTWTVFCSGKPVLRLPIRPGEDISILINGPASYSATGSKLVEDYAALDKSLADVMDEYRALMSSVQVTPDAMAALQNKYEDIVKNFITSNPDSEAVFEAISYLEGGNALEAYEALTPQQRQNPLFIIADSHIRKVRADLEQQQRLEKLQSGEVDAPQFTLMGLDGKHVSLSEFKGKWVVLDFWGAWCKWCIKGFPELKKAYEAYKGKMEVIGIDNRDTPEQWREAVARFKLPWVNVYNPKETADALLEQYGVQGFPTKVIISPEGKIVNITVGEDPNFFTILSTLIEGKN